MKNLTGLLILITILAVSACKKDDPKPEVDENGLTPAINELISEEHLSALVDLGFDINGGGNPPSLEDNEYVISTCYISQSTAGDFPGTTCPDFFVRLYNQEKFEITVDYRHVTQIGQAIGSFIVGEDCKFTVFIEVNEIHTTSGAEARLVLGVSGKLVNNGIENIKIANLMLDNFGNVGNIWIENGTGRLFQDDDEFSEVVGASNEWYAPLPDCPCEYGPEIDGREEMCGEWLDCGSASQTYHYGATYEIRWVPEDAGRPGQQCTYDTNRQLITSGIAAGSPDIDSPDICGWGDILTGQGFPDIDHYFKDVVTWKDRPCYEYLRDWPANKGDNCSNNPVSDIQHMRAMIGEMNCEEVTLIIKSAKESPNLLIDSDLKDFILGESSLSLTNAQLISKLQNWKDLKSCQLFPSDRLCRLLDQAISNLQ